MSMHDELKQERQKLKGKPFAEKFSWFMHYYKWVVIAPIAIVLIILYINSQSLSSRKTPTIDCIFINKPESLQLHLLTVSYGEYVDRKEQISPLNTTSYPLRIRVDGTLDPAYAEFASDLMTLENTGSIDFIFADTASVSYLAKAGLICDMSLVLTGEQMDAFREYIYYVDYSSPTTGETTRYPVGFQVQNTAQYQKCGGPSDTEYILCTVQDPPHSKNIYPFIQFMYQP